MIAAQAIFAWNATSEQSIGRPSQFSEQLPVCSGSFLKISARYELALFRQKLNRPLKILDFTSILLYLKIPVHAF